MKLSFMNLTNLDIVVEFDHSIFLLPTCEHIIKEYSIEKSDVVFRFSIKSDNVVNRGRLCLNVSSEVKCVINNQQEIFIIIDQKTKKYQNYTQYRYLTFDLKNLEINSIRQFVNPNYNDLNNVLNMKIKTKQVIFFLFKKSIIDAVIDGTLIALIVAWVLSVWRGIVAFLFVFIVVFFVNVIMFRLSKSKIRLLNWNRDIELADDVEYLIKNIDEFCD